MSRIAWFSILAVALGGLGCSSAPAPSAADRAGKTLGEMLVVAEAGDWEAYVDGYYGESDKFRSDDDRSALVRRFQERWGEDVVAALRKAATVSPEIVDGSRAEFRVGEETVFVLYRTEGGDWTFHL